MSQMYDTRYDKPSQGHGTFVEFYNRTVTDKKKTAETGAEHFKEAEFVKIRTRADPTTELDLPVRDEHRETYASSYAKFKAGKEQKYGDGFPLDKWALIGAPMVKTLNSMDVYTVEQLAAFPDTMIHRLHQGQTWKQRAIQWLGERSGNEGLQEEVARLTKLVAKMQAAPKKKPKKRSRAKKAVRPAPALDNTTTLE